MVVADDDQEEVADDIGDTAANNPGKAADSKGKPADIDAAAVAVAGKSRSLDADDTAD